MSLLARAPFLAVLFALASTLAVSEQLAPYARPLFSLLMACGFVLCLAAPRKEERRVFLSILCLAAGTSLWVSFRLVRPPVLPAFLKTTGTVTEVRPWGAVYAAAISTPEGGFVLRLPFATLREGDKIELEGKVRSFRGASGKSGFREDRFWRARGMIGRVSAPKTKVLPGGGWNLYRWRHALYRFLSIRLPRLTGAYLNAAWTGKRDGDLYKRHRAWGTSHLLAISGFHVGLLMAALSFVWFRGRTRVWVLSLLLWGYVLMTGAAPSAARAGLMIQVALLGELVGRPGSAINSVSLAAVILLLYSPFLFWDIGWRLSVLAALVIAALLERSAPGDWRIWLLVSPFIWMATFPQVSWTFGAVPVAGLLLNFIAPSFFAFMFSIASAAALIRFLGLPVRLLPDAVEGGFILWEILAGAVVALVSWGVAWNYLLVHCCAVFFVVLMGRALFVSWTRLAVVAPLGSLMFFLLLSF